MDPQWIYLVEFKVTPGISGLSWVRLGQFKSQAKAVKFAEECRRNSTRDTPTQFLSGRTGQTHGQGIAWS